VAFHVAREYPRLVKTLTLADPGGPLQIDGISEASLPPATNALRAKVAEKKKNQLFIPLKLETCSKIYRRKINISYRIRSDKYKIIPSTVLINIHLIRIVGVYMVENEIIYITLSQLSILIIHRA